MKTVYICDRCGDLLREKDAEIERLREALESAATVALAAARVCAAARE